MKDVLNKYGLSRNDVNFLAYNEFGLNEHEINEYLERIAEDPIKLKKFFSTYKNYFDTKKINNAEEILNKNILNCVKKFISGNAFAKVLKSNELGFRNGKSRKAGTFVLIPKNCISIFPSLSRDIENDSKYIDVKLKPENEVRKIDYIYHNSKYSKDKDRINKGGRDEYRIYFNNEINDENIVLPNDILIILKSEDVNMYYFYRFNKNNSLYDILINLIKKYKNSKTDAALIPLAELFVNNLLTTEIIDYNSMLKDNCDKDEDIKTRQAWEINAQELELLLKNCINGDVKTISREVKQIKRDSKFRKNILSIYGNKCAITGLSINYNKLSNLQACHIIPKEYGGGDNPTNGIALDRNFHWAFDNGMFTIDDNYFIIVHEEAIENILLSNINGKKINMPIDKTFYPNKEALKYHRDNVYGSFLKK